MNKKEVDPIEPIKDLYTFYRSHYESIAQQSSPLIALNTIQQSKQILIEEHEEIRAMLAQDIKELMKEPYNTFEDIGSIRSFLEFKFKKGSSIINTNSPHEKNIKNFTELFLNAIKDNFSERKELLAELYQSHAREVRLSHRINTLVSIIEKAIYQSHPLALDPSLTEQEQADIEHTSTSKVGRRREIPTQIVKEFVTTCLVRASNQEKGTANFIKADGTPNQRQLGIELLKQVDRPDISLRTAERNINRVIEEYDIINSVMS